MGFIKKYKMFTEEFTAAPIAPAKPISEEDILEASEVDVIDRFARIYKDLPKDEKQQINNYFK